MFTVLQRYRVRLGTVADAAARAEETLVPSLKQAPGFVAYQFLHTGDGTVAALAVFETKPAADAAARVLSDWFRSDWPAFRLLAPDLSVAESLTLEQTNGAARSVLAPRSENGAADQAPGAQRQVTGDRRRNGERRVFFLAGVPERRRGVDRRVTLDRRAGAERRGGVAPAETVAQQERRRIAPAWRRREAFHSR